MNTTTRAATVAVLALASACSPARAAAPAVAPTPGSLQDTTLVTVTGNASVQVPSDRARIQVAVETEAASAEAASRANAEAMNRVLARVRPASGSGARIETTGYQLTPRYRQPSDRNAPPEIAGYRALNQVVVVLDEVDRVGGVLDAALGAGANRVTGLSFFASDTEPARLEAVRDATARARREAEAVADALGLAVHSAATVHTSLSGSAPVYRAQAMEALQVMDTPVESGSQSVDASVTITFRLLPREGR